MGLAGEAGPVDRAETGAAGERPGDRQEGGRA